MQVFELLTPMTYWFLIVIWSFILIFYLKRLKSEIQKKDQLIFVLLTILSIDAFRTLFESFYFGAWYTSLAGLLPEEIHTFLVQPQMVFIPKIVNVIAGLFIIIILIYRWLPKEEQEKIKLEKLVEQRNTELIQSNKQLQKEVAEHNQVVQLLRESEIRFKALHNASFGGITIHDRGIILECNQGLSTMTGYPITELIGMDGLLLIAEKSRDEVRNNIGNNYEKPYEAIGLRKNGEEYPIRLEARRIPYKGKNVRVVEFRDITERVKAIADKEKIYWQLLQSQKMESLGSLAGGIAHDFNNILTPILGYTELLKIDIPSDSPLQSSIEEMQHATYRARDLVKQILTLSRQTDQEMKPIKLQPIIKEALKLLRASIPTTLDIQQDINPDCGIIYGDSTQIHQIIMNLVTNAYHAIENSNGNIVVTLNQIYLELDQSLFLDLPEGEYALLKISDKGVGIPKNILDKIFDPYFTTKEKGKGTGLGLSVVQGILKSINGDISIYSEPNKGTEVYVYIPIIKKGDFKKEIDDLHPIIGGTENILIVDDEEAIVKLMKDMLERLGYKITKCINSVEALQIFKTNLDFFDLIITDMTMPNMTGSQLAKEIKKLKPNIPIIICTGFSEQINEKKCKSIGLQGFVMKPIIKREIAKIIRKALNKSKDK